MFFESVLGIIISGISNSLSISNVGAFAYLKIYGEIWNWDEWKVNIVHERPYPSEHKNPIIKHENLL